MTDFPKNYEKALNPDGNPNIAEAGKATRFGQPDGPDPRASAIKSNAPKHSVRAAVRRIAAMDVEQVEELLRSKNARARLSMAEFTALAKFHAVIKGNLKAMQAVTDDVDGKLVQKQVNTDVSLEQLVTGSFDYDESSAEDQPLAKQSD